MTHRFVMHRVLEVCCRCVGVERCCRCVAVCFAVYVAVYVAVCFVMYLAVYVAVC